LGDSTKQVTFILTHDAQTEEIDGKTMQLRIIRYYDPSTHASYQVSKLDPVYIHSHSNDIGSKHGNVSQGLLRSGEQENKV
jgi:hypothetical protein